MSESYCAGHAKTTQTVRKNAHEFEHFLELDQPFTIRDSELCQDEFHRRVRRLKHCYAVENVGERLEEDSRGRERWVVEYELTEKARQEIELALEQDTLPCGHRAHVCNPPEVDGLSCKYCRELNDETPVYTKAEVRELL